MERDPVTMFAYMVALVAILAFAAAVPLAILWALRVCGAGVPMSAGGYFAVTILMAAAGVLARLARPDRGPR